MMALPISWRRFGTRAGRAYLLALLCVSCGSNEITPPAGGGGGGGGGSGGGGGGGGGGNDAGLVADASQADVSADGRDDRSVDGNGPDRSIDGPGLADGATSDGAPSDQLAPPDGDGGDGRPILKPTCTVDQPCMGGDCIGSSCDKPWDCFQHLLPHPCPFETIPYCGCDNKTYFYPLTCAEIPYLHAGACGDGVNCDPNDIRCTQPEPDCGMGKAASVVDGCYGPCVEITQCRCVFVFECPHRELYTCNSEQRCDVPPQP